MDGVPGLGQMKKQRKDEAVTEETWGRLDLSLQTTGYLLKHCGILLDTRERGFQVSNTTQ